MSSDSKSCLNLPIYEQAADWLIELREGDIDAGTRERLDAWFRASPEHIRAYLELSSIWEEGADPDLDRAHSTEELIARAQETSSVIPLSANSLDSQDVRVESFRKILGTHSAARASSTGESTASGTSDPPSETRSGHSRAASPDRRHGGTLGFWRRRPVWIAAALAACAVGSASLYLYGQRNLDLTTETGEQRFVSLVDGSTLELNSRSRVRIRFSDRERDVDLIEGQALFHVAKDAERPFIVKSGTTLVRAVGTQFDVYRKVSGTTITVVEGRVAVLSPMLDAAPGLSPSGSAVLPQAPPSSRSTHAPRPADAQSAASVSLSIKKREQSGTADGALSNAPNAIYLIAGEQITVGSQSVPRATYADPTVATAWTQHQLVFESTPLNDVAQDFNRYNTRQLIVSDPALREFHITGVFSSTDPASLLRFLRAQRGITVEETDTEIRISK